MVKKLKTKKLLMYFFGIIIVLYLGYFILKSSIFNYEGYKNTVCDKSSDCQDDNCVRGFGITHGFCAPWDFTADEFRAAEPYVDDATTTIKAAAGNDGISYWLKNNLTRSTCLGGLNTCAKSVPENQKWLCSTNADCKSNNCYTNPGDNAGKQNFCAPIGFNKSKYKRAPAYVNDDTIISSLGISDWTTAPSRIPTCIGKIADCGSTLGADVAEFIVSGNTHGGVA